MFYKHVHTLIKIKHLFPYKGYFKSAKMKKRFCSGFRNYIREYCKSSSVHGLQYIGEKQRTYFERTWWFLIFIACLIGCGLAIYEVYKKWDQSPVIVNFANSGTPIYKIPFPAVTICPESKSDEDKFNFTQIMLKLEKQQNLTSTEKIHFNYMSSLCDYKSQTLENISDTVSDDFYDVLNDLKPVFNITDCTFVSERFGCNDIFVPILTAEGICYTFNMVDREFIFKKNVVHYKDFHSVRIESDWSLQNGYDDDAGVQAYPLRASLSGAENGLSFNILTPKESSDFACRHSVQGYRVVLHTPMTIPWPKQKFFRIPLHQNVIGAIQPTIVTTSKRIERYDPKKRNCYFGDERPLKYFNNYTSSNCKLECVTNFTLKMCDCVDFYMPRENGTEICSAKMFRCMKFADKLMQWFDLAENLNDTDAKDMLKNSGAKECGCLPVCSDLTYEAGTTQTDWHWNQWLIVHNNLSHKSYLSSVTLFFKSDSFLSSERNELYGPIDFLANFGGLLGLFTGFSIISVMEIIYFLSVRIICNLWIYGKWAGPKSEPKAVEIKAN